MPQASRRPLIVEIDTRLSPAEAFELFRNDPFPFFLDSGMDPHKLGRYSFIGSSPFLVLSTRGTDVTFISGGQRSHSWGNPFDLLNELLSRYRLDCCD